MRAQFEMNGKIYWIWHDDEWIKSSNVFLHEPVYRGSNSHNKHSTLILVEMQHLCK